MTLEEQARQIVKPIIEQAGVFASMEQEIEYRSSKEHLVFIKKLIDEDDVQFLYVAAETAAVLSAARVNMPDWLLDFQNEILTCTRRQYPIPRPTKTNRRDYPLALAAFEVAKQLKLTLYVDDWTTAKGTAAELVAKITGMSPNVVRHAIKKYRGLQDAVEQVSKNSQSVKAKK